MYGTKGLDVPSGLTVHHGAREGRVILPQEELLWSLHHCLVATRRALELGFWIWESWILNSWPENNLQVT